MPGVYKGLTIELGANKTPLDNALKSVSRDARKLQKDLKSIDKGLKFDSRSPEMLRQKIQKVGEQVKNTEKRLDYLRKAVKENSSEKISTEQWVELQGEIAECEARLKAYNAQMKELAATQAANSSVLGKAGNFLTDNAATFEKVGGSMQSAGRTLTHTLTPAIIAGGAGIVKTTVDIDSALTGVKKTVDATAEEYEALKDAAIEFSKTSAVSATDILQAEELGGQLGVAKENLEAFAKVTTSLDIATNMNVEDASTEMARFFNVTQQVTDSTKTAEEQYNAYGNVIVGLGNNLATTESEISAFSLRMASAGALAGMSQADIMGLGGAMSSLGLEAEAGGTAFSRTITQIGLAVSHGGDELEGFAKIAGMSADDFAAKWKDDATGAFIDFINGLAAGNEAGEDMNVMLEDLGITAIRQSDAIRRLAGNTSLLGDAVELANEQWKNGTAMGDEVANRNESMAAQFEMLKHRIQAVAEEVGEPLVHALLDVVDAAEPLFQKIEEGAKAFSEMSKEEQQTVLKTVGFLAILGPLTTGMGKVVAQIGPMGIGMAKLSKSLAMLDMVGMAGDMGKVAPAAANTSKAVEGIGKASKVASVGMGALKASAALLVVAGLALAVSQAKEYYDHMRRVEKATDGVRDAMQGSFKSSPKAVLEEAADGAEDYAKSLNELRDQHEKVLEANARLADSIKDTYAELGDKNSVIDNFRDSLDMLESTASPTEAQLADVKIAIDQMNAAFGEHFELVQNADGSYSVITSSAAEAAQRIDELRSGLGENAQLTDEQLAQLQEEVQKINEEFGTTYAVSGSAEEGYQIVGSAADNARQQVDGLLASMKAQAAYEAFSKLGTESSAALQEASSNLADVQLQFANAESAVNDYKRALDENPGDLALIENLDDASTELGILQGQLQEAQGAYDAAASAAEVFSSAQNLMMQATDANASALTRAVAGNDLLVNSFVAAGKDIGAFKDTLEAVGVTEEGINKLSNLSATEAEALARAYEGSYSDIESTLATLGIELDEQSRNAVKAAEENQKAAEKIADSWREAFSGEGINIDELTASVGTTVEELAATLDKVGLSMADFAAVGAEGFEKLYKAADGDISKVLQKCRQLDDLGIDPKYFEVSDDGSIVDAYGNLIDLDAMTIGGKPFYVDDQGTIQRIIGEVADLDAMEISPDEYTVNDNDTVTDLAGKLAALDAVKIGDKYYRVVTKDAEDSQKKAQDVKKAAEGIPAKTQTNITMKDLATEGLRKAKEKVIDLNGRGATVTAYANTSPLWNAINTFMNRDFTKYVNVRASITQNAAGGVIPKHMAGGIFTKATLTNVGIVGEAGAEAWLDGPGNSSAIVPLSNRRYVRPFAQAVAAEMGHPSGSRITNYNISIDGNTLASDARLMGAFETFMGEVIRKSDM